MIRTIAGRLHKEIAARNSRKLAYRTAPGALVSFTFDDFPRSALDVGGQILVDRGVRGTYYAALGLMGTRTEVGEICNVSDLRSLVAVGHELACHGFDHQSCYRNSANALEESCNKNRKLAAELVGGYKLQNYAFPFGEATLSSKSVLKQCYHTCRGTTVGTNRSPVDLALLRANPAYSRLPVGPLKKIIAEGISQKAWTILYTHDVDPHPSLYGCTPEYLTELLSFVLNSGAEVVTVAEAANRFQVQT